MLTANVAEIFSSIQGEGLYVGCRQVFVRFSGCNIRCIYCDTTSAQMDCAFAQIERLAGRRVFDYVDNPIDVKFLADKINKLLVTRHHSISLTGGEPLCHTSFIKQLIPLLQAPIFLETNGTLPSELEEIISLIDIVSMDIKLPAIVRKDYWQQHHDFLRIARNSEVFVKIVVTDNVNDEEFSIAIDLIENIDKTIPLIIQPVTPNQYCPAISPAKLLQLQEYALNKLTDVRVIPQTHKYLGQL